MSWRGISEWCISGVKMLVCSPWCMSGVDNLHRIVTFSVAI